MNFDLTEDQLAIRAAVGKVCQGFDDDDWLTKDRDGGFPQDFYAAMAGAGWLGIAMPSEYGGSGLGICDAALMMGAVSASGAGMSGASAIHMNVFGLHPVVVHGSDAQKRRWLPPIIDGHHKACFGVTEPNTGLNTLALKTRAVRKGDRYVVNGQKIWISTAQVVHKILLLARTTPLEEVKFRSQGLSLFYTDLDRSKIEVREIDKLGRKAVDSNQLFIDGLEIPLEDRVGEEGRGFEYILHGLNPERVLLAAEATGLGRVALQRAARYARERVVFDRPIGMNRGSSTRSPNGGSIWRLPPCSTNARPGCTTKAARAALRPMRPSSSVPRRAPGLRDRPADAWRHGLCQGIPRGAVLPRGHAAAHRSHIAATDFELHCREGPGHAQVLLSPSSDQPCFAVPVHAADLLLEQLAGIRSWQGLGDEVHATWAFDASQPRTAQCQEFGPQGIGIGDRLRCLDDRVDRLPQFLVRDSDHCHILDEWMALEHGLHLLRVDIHPTGNDHVGLAVSEVKIAVGIDMADVSQGHPALGVAGGFRLCRVVQVVERPSVPQVDQAGLPGGTFVAPSIHYVDLRSRSGPAYRALVRQPIVRIDAGIAHAFTAAVHLVQHGAASKRSNPMTVPPQRSTDINRRCGATW